MLLSENLLQRRERTLEALLATCYEFVEDLSSDEPKIYTCYGSITEAPCASRALGSFIRGLRKLDIWPKRPTAQDMKLSVDDFRASLSAIEIPTDTHERADPLDLIEQVPLPCGTGLSFRAAVGNAEVLHDVPSMTDVCEEHLKKVSPGPEEQPPAWIWKGESDWGFRAGDFMTVDISDSEDEDYESASEDYESDPMDYEDYEDSDDDLDEDQVSYACAESVEQDEEEEESSA